MSCRRMRCFQFCKTLFVYRIDRYLILKLWSSKENLFIYILRFLIFISNRYSFCRNCFYEFCKRKLKTGRNKDTIRRKIINNRKFRNARIFEKINYHLKKNPYRSRLSHLQHGCKNLWLKTSSHLATLYRKDLSHGSVETIIPDRMNFMENRSIDWSVATPTIWTSEEADSRSLDVSLNDRLDEPR